MAEDPKAIAVGEKIIGKANSRPHQMEKRAHSLSFRTLGVLTPKSFIKALSPERRLVVFDCTDDTQSIVEPWYDCESNGLGHSVGSVCN